MDVPGGYARVVGRSCHLSDGEEDEGRHGAGVADEDDVRDCEQEADNVTAVKANGAAAGRAAVAAAGAGEVASAAAAVSNA